jgi:hypothetical protein
MAIMCVVGVFSKKDDIYYIEDLKNKNKMLHSRTVDSLTGVAVHTVSLSTLNLLRFWGPYRPKLVIVS